MPEQPVSIYSAENLQQATLLCGLLQQQGIKAWISNNALQMAVGQVPVGTATAPRVMVADADAAAARDIAIEFDQKIYGPKPAEVSVEGERDRPAWPTCPHCAAPRQTKCPSCGMAGIDFPLADYSPLAAPLETTAPSTAAAAERVDASGLLLCDSCDEAFAPQFYRYCQRCDYDFGQGLELDEEVDVVPTRALVVAVGLSLLAAGLLVYFWILLRG